MKKFWDGKRVLLTGDTGFKGAWMALWLHNMGAEVYGFSLPPETAQPSLFSLIEADKLWKSCFGNIQIESELVEVVKASNPEIVIHMAGQAIVGRSYQDPVDTYATNLMGTVNLLSALKNHASPKAILAITSDKVYENSDTGISFAENDRLGGDDPYSASKACAELAINSWRTSYFDKMGVPLVSARGSNVIGGGDWSQDRLIPNYIRSIDAGNPSFIMRNPNSVRAWQHVMDTVNGYLIYAQSAYEKKEGLPHSLNFGPPSEQALTASTVVNLLQEYMDYPTVVGTKYGKNYKQPYPEKNTLLIDASLAGRTLAWEPILSPQQAINWTAQWYNSYFNKKDICNITLNQIKKFEEIKHGKEQLSILQGSISADTSRSWQHAVGQ